MLSQMCVYVALPVSSVLTSWLNKLRSVFNIALPPSNAHSPSTSSGICVVPGLTAAGKVQLSASLPFAVAAAMVLILVANWALPRVCKRRKHSSVEIPLTERLLSAAEVEGSRSVSPARSRVAATSSSSHPSERMRSKYIAAGLNLFLTVYSSLLVTTVAMLHCVHVPGQPLDTTSLFIQGSRTCDFAGWQFGYVVSALLLACIPLVIPWAATWAVRYRASLRQSLGISNTPLSWKDDACAGVLSALVAPYDSSMPWWESIMMLHRLGLAFLFTFASSSPAIQSLLATMLCVCFFGVHLYRQPFRRSESQGLQTVLLFCLSIVTVAKVFYSSGLQYAVPSDPRITSAISSTNFFCEVITVLFQYLFPGIALLASYFFS